MFTKWEREDRIRPLIKEIDWTMTYRKGSDIYSPYGLIRKCDNTHKTLSGTKTNSKLNSEKT